MASVIKFVIKHKVVIILSIIILLSAFLRLYRIGDYMTFLGDEGRDLLEVRKILSGHPVLLGPRSSAADFYYGPIYYYMITPFLLLFRYDPVGPAVFVALLGIITVYLIYHVGKELLSENAGLFAAALYSVSPLVIAYARSSWNPNPLPFFSLLILYCIYKAVKKNSRKLFLLTGVLMGIAIQLQYLALFLDVIVILFIFIGLIASKQSRRILIIVRNYTLLVLGFLVGWSPFLMFEIRHGFPNFKTIIQFIFFSNADKVYITGGGFIQNIEIVFFKLFARLVTRFPPPESVNVNLSLILRAWQITTIILGIIAVISIFKLKNKLSILLFSLWFFIGIFLFGFYKKTIYDYYLGFMFPLPFLLIGNLSAKIFESKMLKVYGKLIALVLFLILFIFNLKGNPFQYQPNRQKDQVKQIAEFVLSKTDNKPYNFALITQSNSDHAYRYYFDILNHSPREIENLQLDPKRKSVTTQLLIVCEDITCKPLGYNLWEVAGFGRAEIAGVWNVSVVKIYKLIPYKM
jgi:4-amino-4-deoxy-L-arabinose transferase-like glycosyltransferase